MKPTRPQINNAVKYSVALIGHRPKSELGLDMKMGGAWPKGAGLGQQACDAVASVLNVYIEHHGGNDTIRAGDLTPGQSLKEVADVADGKF